MQQSQLWLRVAAPFLLFVAAGTVGILLLLNAAYQQRSSSDFAALAQANAEFIRAAHIPPTDRFAGYLSQVLGVEVQFQRVAATDSRHEVVTVTVQPGVDLTLIRKRSTLLLRPATLGALAVFWALSFALAWAVVVPYLKAQRLAMLGRMATSLAHEVQNPVAAIQLHAQLDGNKTILGEAATIESLVNQWMFLAKPEPPQKKPVALDALLADAIAALNPMAEYAHVKIVLNVGQVSNLPNPSSMAGCKPAPHCTLVDADARRLGQAFRNLIVNAIQAMPTGGSLTISAHDRIITFADTGPGFSATALARCPAMFYSEKEGGMGIGLAVVNEVVKAHGGRLALANQPAGGAVVTITL
jgi:signal transduction histidine kinase